MIYNTHTYIYAGIHILCFVVDVYMFDNVCMQTIERWEIVNCAM